MRRPTPIPLDGTCVSRSEMNEVILQFSAYSGFPKGRVLQTAAGPKGD